MKRIDWQSLQPAPIIGVDEVGRGCLAGPVYAAAVVLNEDLDFSEYTDSKLLSEDRREILSGHIQAHHRYAIAIATVEEITRLNILHASFLAMLRAVAALKLDTGHVVVDGKMKIPRLPPRFEQTAVVKGDLLVPPVGAASIVAKVARDTWIREQGEKFPQYGFASHKGYATAEHRTAIAKFGPCVLHRPTFAGVKEFL